MHKFKRKMDVKYLYIHLNSTNNSFGVNGFNYFKLVLLNINKIFVFFNYKNMI
jgi:hypothetical protein